MGLNLNNFMLISSLFERVNINASNRVIDLRDTNAPVNLSNTHITLTRDGGALIWNYARGNKIDWHYPNPADGEGLSIIGRRECDNSIQDDWMSMRFTKNGVMLNISRGNFGKRNIFSLDNRKIVERLLDLRIVTLRTPIFIGNWAKRDEDGEFIGSVAKIINATDIPNRIILYHGTSNARAAEILRNGLSPVDVEMRTQKEALVADHRVYSVYLTASLQQAKYYARKAVDIDRIRFSYNYRSRLHGKYLEWKYDISHDALTREKKIKKAQEVFNFYEKLSNSIDKVLPTILKIELSRRDYKNFLADDDFIKSNPNASPNDWRESLSNFGQVAFRGNIPPEKITLY
jgi:hypothetical protein